MWIFIRACLVTIDTRVGQSGGDDGGEKWCGPWAFCSMGMITFAFSQQEARRQHGAQFKESYHRDQACCSSLAWLVSTVTLGKPLAFLGLGCCWGWLLFHLFKISWCILLALTRCALIRDLVIIYFITFSFGLLNCHINHVCLRLLVLDTLYLIWTKFFQPNSTS